MCRREHTAHRTLKRLVAPPRWINIARTSVKAVISAASSSTSPDPANGTQPGKDCRIIECSIVLHSRL